MNVRSVFRFFVTGVPAGSVVQSPRLPGDVVALVCLSDGGRPIRMHPSGRFDADHLPMETGTIWPVEGPFVAFSVATVHTDDAMGLPEPQRVSFAGLTADQVPLYLAHPIQKRADRKIPSRWNIGALSTEQLSYFDQGVTIGTAPIALELENLGGASLVIGDTQAGAAIGQPLAPGAPIRWAGPLWINNPTAGAIDVAVVVEVQTEQGQ